MARVVTLVESVSTYHLQRERQSRARKRARLAVKRPAHTTGKRIKDPVDNYCESGVCVYLDIISETFSLLGIRANPSAGTTGYVNGINSAILRYAGAKHCEPATEVLPSNSTRVLNEANLHVRHSIFHSKNI